MKESKALIQIQVKSRCDLFGVPWFWRTKVKFFRFVAISHPRKSMRHRPKMILMTKGCRDCFPLITNEESIFLISEISFFNWFLKIDKYQ